MSSSQNFATTLSDDVLERFHGAYTILASTDSPDPPGPTNKEYWPFSKSSVLSLGLAKPHLREGAPSEDVR